MLISTIQNSNSSDEFNYSNAISPHHRKSFDSARDRSDTVIVSPLSTTNGSTKLHELCGLENPSLDMIRMFATAYPWTLKLRDSNGNIPLHCALNRDEPRSDVVCTLLNLFGEGARVLDKRNTLPLFLAVRRKVSTSIMKALLAAHPAAARTKSYGCFALHHLIQQGNASTEAIRALLNANPEAALLPNVYGNIPLHFLCSSASASLDTIRLLMYCHPTTIAYTNKAGETPIARALNLSSKKSVVAEHEELREKIRLLLRLADKACLNDDQVQLLRDLNWAARKVVILVCVQFRAAATGGPAQPNLMELYLGCDGVYRNIIEFL